MADNDTPRRIKLNDWRERVQSDPYAWKQTRIGLDWGERETAFAVVTVDGLVADTGKIGNDLTGLMTLLALATTFADPATGAHPQFVVEPTRRPLVDSLLSHGEVVFVTSPHVLAEKRGKKGKRIAKSDIRDAIDLGNHGRTEPTKVHRAAPMDAESILIAGLVADHRRAVRIRTQHASRLRSIAAEYYPTILACYSASDLADTAAAWAVLRAAPTHRDLAQMTLEDITTVVRTVQNTRHHTTSQRIHLAIQQTPTPLTYDRATEDQYAIRMKRIVDDVEAAHHRCVAIDAKIVEAIANHPATELFSDATGLGPSSLAGLLGTAVARIDEFNGRRAFLAWSGVVPTIKQSGGGEDHKRRDTLAAEVSKAAWHWAFGASRHQPVAALHYWRHRADGDQHPTAIRKLAARLMAGFFHCLKTGEVFRDDIVWKTDLTPDEVAAKTAELRAKVDSKKTGAAKAKAANPRRKTLDTLRATDEDSDAAATANAPQPVPQKAG